MSSRAKLTFIIKTLGCKVNQYESQIMRESLLRCGFIEGKPDTAADVYIVNSCTVTHRADRDTRNLIHGYRARNPEAHIVVAGCYAETADDRSVLARAGASLQVRNSEKGLIGEMLRDACGDRHDGRRYGVSGDGAITGFDGKDRAFVKIQDGCDFRCSYCKVRIVRGRSRSRSVDTIQKEIRALSDRGFKEIVITGVCLGAWGRDAGTKADITDLLWRISDIQGDFRIRLSSIEPTHITPELIACIAQNRKVCKHVHIPLQSGDDGILKSMHRPYRSRQYERTVRDIRSAITDVAISTDLLIGFPGEDETAFGNTLACVERIRPFRMHLFSYSKRDGTEAARCGRDCDRETIRSREKILHKMGRALAADYAAGFIGKKESVIVESRRDRATGLLTGYTDRYIRVCMEGSDLLMREMASVTIERIDNATGTVYGRVEKA
jgi:threonylcarbamoyladenosine tRNA methylthiotransferase MtaB